MGGDTPVVMIGLDAAEATLIERWCADGTLPALAALRRQGCFGRLNGEATIFAGAVWPTLYTGRRVAWHGIYHDEQWHHQKMRFEAVHDSWLSPTPFWELLDRGYRVAVVDAPMTLRAAPSPNGIVVSGWGTHDRVFSGTRPRNLAARLARECGRPVLSVPFVRPRTAAEFLAARDNLVATTEQMAQLSRFLLGRRSWDVFCVVFGAPHRGGHHLWDLSQIEESGTASLGGELERALEQVYRACDRAVAEVIDAAPVDARVLVFAAHGMGPNPGWNDRFDEILSAIRGAGADGRRARPRSAVRRELGNALSARLPSAAARYLAQRRRTRSFDWNATRYFPLPMDHAGYVRINLAGREPRGIVQSGAEYHALCDELREALSAVRDIDTDEPIVERVYRIDDLAPADAPYRNVLPDLVITWHARSAIRSRGIYRRGYGARRWNGSVLPSLRSGNHRDDGWFIAIGRGIERGSQAHGHHIVDLVPTLFAWLGAGGGQAFHGEPIAALCGQGPTISERS